MLIAQDDILKAKQRIGIRQADMIADLLHMEKYNSTRHVGCCPVHDDLNPSCSYDPKTYKYKCFGCGATFDLIQAYIMSKNKTFLGACEELFEEAEMGYDFTERGAAPYNRKEVYPDFSDTTDNVYAYWKIRGISPETIDYLGIREDKKGNTVFPYMDENDCYVFSKIRPSRAVKKGESKCWCVGEASPLLFNMTKTTPEEPLIIATGEGDCAALIECGFTNAVSIPLGDQNTHWIEENWDYLQQFDSILLAHDNDSSGEKFAKEVSVRLGEYRVKIVDVPKVHINEDGSKRKVKDINELLFLEGKEAITNMIRNARDRDIDSVVDYTEVEDFDMSDADGITTGIPDLDCALGKLYEGSTTIITGVAGSGKSSFLSMILCQAVDQGFPCWIYSGELDSRSLRSWIKSVHAGQRGLNQYFSAAGKPYYKVKPDVSRKINDHYKGQLYFYKESAEPTADKLLETMEMMVRRKGTKVFVIDNLTVVGLNCDDKSKYIKQEEFIRAVIDFGKKWHVICILVLHPRKLDMVRKMNIFDLQGVTAAGNLSHRILSLYRVQPKEKEGERSKRGDGWYKEPEPHDVIITCLKDRYGSALNLDVPVFYDQPSRRFFTDEANLDYRYDWDDTDYGDKPLPFGIPQIERLLNAENEVYGEVS